MQYELKGIHYTPSEKTREFFDEKVKHLERLQDNVHNLEFIVTKTTHGYELSSNMHLKWGSLVHIEESGPELFPVVDIVIDKLHHKLSKEKEKISGHH